MGSSEVHVGIAILLSLALSCGACAGKKAPDAGPSQDRTDGTEIEPGESALPLLPKRDWNGLTVMMREAEARAAVEAVGFALVPSRLDTFPVLDLEKKILTLVPTALWSPPIVVYETVRERRVLDSVYGVRLFFHRNHLFSFQPVYFMDPVDLVEPGDVAIGPGVMRERLFLTFGKPRWEGTGTISLQGGKDAGQEQMLLWQDPDLAVLYRDTSGEDPPEYALQFFSPKGVKAVGGLVFKNKQKGPIIQP